MPQDELEEVIALLIRLIIDGIISEDEANSIIDHVRETGDLPTGFQMPLPLDEAIPDNLAEIIAGYLIASIDPHYDIDKAQEEFERLVEQLTHDWLFAKIVVHDWHEKFRDALIAYLATAAASGAFTDIRGTDREAQVIAMIQVQLAYLSRFADSVAINFVSEGQMYNRAKMYSGEGRGEFYRQKGQTNALFGWVEDYLAVDDQSTCEPCRQAEAAGPYLPGVGPMPGSVCLGRGYCRCRREVRYDMALYLRLTEKEEAQPVAA